MPTKDAAKGTVPHIENSKEKEVARASPKEVAPGTPQAGVQRALRALLGVACGKLRPILQMPVNGTSTMGTKDSMTGMVLRIGMKLMK